MPSRLLHHNFVFLLPLLLFAAAGVPAAAAGNAEAAFLSSWLNSTVPDWSPLAASPCNWSRITCDGRGSVAAVDLRGVAVAGPIPPELCSALPSLVNFSASAANVTGELPPELAQCGRLDRLDLSSNAIAGGIPPLPASLRQLLLFDNRLSGEVPESLGDLSRLEVLRLGGNRDLNGPIPPSLSRLSRLQVLGLADTKISGEIPAALGTLQNLQTLSIYTTMISGAIPPELGNCSSLVDVYLYENALSGELPAALGRLPRLERLLLWQNQLTGPIPASFGNLSSLISIDISINAISGAIPASLGGLPALQDLMLSDNNLTGAIPPSLAGLASLVQLQLDTNQLSGLIPPELGALTKLTTFFAWQNNLEGAIPPELASLAALTSLDLSHNRLTGVIPPAIFLLQNLTKLLLLNNDLSGAIPPEIGRAANLVRLRLGGNRFTGVIPSEVGGMASLNFLDLSGNRLSGAVPPELGNCSQLQMLDLSNNTLSGPLPESLAGIGTLQVLDASHNQLTGAVPDSFGELKAMNKLVLRGNALSGVIPASLGQCRALELLDLSDNKFTGGIPDELCRLEGLDIALNLSRNAITGAIPARISALGKLSVLDVSFNMLEGSLTPLAGMENLVSLNVSHNNFTGYLPDTKLFRQLSASDLSDNAGLCTSGGDVCFAAVDGAGNVAMTSADEARREHRLKLAIALLVTATVAMLLGIIGIVRARRIRRSSSSDDPEAGDGDLAWPWQFQPFQKLTFSVEQVVKNLVEANVVGKGCSGVVYRVDVDDGQKIAVKKLWPSHGPNITGGNNSNNNSARVRDSFSAEVRTLGSIRHKNIVRFLGCGWNRSTRLLMYDYMVNGSLGALLHERRRALDWDLRYRIVLGAAQGLAYLHHDCVPPIVHRDIKANNILIGDDFEPYIADFGLAKLVEAGDFARSSNTVAGSYGYIAPEYGYMMKITEKSDVYSYGVVVLEVLTGKQPIDPTIPDGLHVVDWVRRHRGAAGAAVLDPSLRGRPDGEVEEMLQVMGVALLCVSSMPDERPTMKDVSAMLKELRHEREEYAKVDALLLKGSAAAAATATEVNSKATTSASTTPAYLRSSSSGSDSSSFVAAVCPPAMPMVPAAKSKSRS